MFRTTAHADIENRNRDARQTASAAHDHSARQGYAAHSTSAYQGNQSALRRLSRPPSRIQCKLEIGAVDDPLEAEADRVADQVMRMPEPTLGMSTSPPRISRKCASCEEEDKKLSAKADGVLAKGEAPPIVHKVLGSQGQPLDRHTRTFMEPRFGRDFSNVKIHADSLAAESAEAVDARAYTVGNNIAFASGRFAPATAEGRSLLAHELAHISQQGSSALHRQAEPDAESINFSRGYQDGLSGMPSSPGPLDSKGRSDYNDGYAKGQDASPTGANLPAVPATQPVVDAVTPSATLTKTDARGQAGAPKPEQQQGQSWYEQKKWAIYRGIIAGAKQANKTACDALRSQIGRLPQELQEPAGTMVDVIGAITDMCMALMLAIIGLAVGFVQGIATFVEGLVKLPFKLVQAAIALFQHPLDSLTDLAATAKAVPSRLQATISAWWERYRKANPEEQVLMGTELVGEFEAVLATFQIPTGKIVSASTRYVRTGVAAAMIGTAEAAPAAIAGATGRMATTLVDESAVYGVEGAVGQTAEAAIKLGNKTAIKVSGHAIEKMGAEEIAAGLKEAEGAQAAKVAKEAEAAKAAIAGAEEIKLSVEEYEKALSMVFPSQFADAVAKLVDNLGQRAAERAMENPRFVSALNSGNMTLAGTFFHSAAAQEAKAIAPGLIPNGWKLSAEDTLKAGKGGSRLDIFLEGPAGELVEFDWKTSGKSALSTGSRKEMARHAGEVIVQKQGETLARQESRSWLDYVRPLSH